MIKTAHPGLQNHEPVVGIPKASLMVGRRKVPSQNGVGRGEGGTRWGIWGGPLWTASCSGHNRPPPCPSTASEWLFIIFYWNNPYFGCLDTYLSVLINTLTISCHLAQYWAKQPAPTIHKEITVFLRAVYPLFKEEYITLQGPGVCYIVELFRCKLRLLLLRSRLSPCQDLELHHQLYLRYVFLP